MADIVLGGYVDKAGVKRSVKGVTLVGSTLDSGGNPLPVNFTSLGGSTNTTWDGFFPLVETTSVVSGSDTYTQTVTYTNDGTNIISEVTSKWVKS